MAKKNSNQQDITLKELISLGKYVVHAMENPDNEIDIRWDILDTLKKEVTFTERFMGSVPQDDPELMKIISYFNRQTEIVDEVILRPHMKQEIEFTVKFITSNQKRINTILNDASK